MKEILFYYQLKFIDKKNMYFFNLDHNLELVISLAYNVSFHQQLFFKFENPKGIDMVHNHNHIIPACVERKFSYSNCRLI